MTDLTLLGSIGRDADGGPAIAFDQTYATDVADLWDAVTDADRLARWFAPVHGNLTLGGRFSIRFDDGEIPGCRVTACDAPRSFTWEWPHGDQASLVRVELEAAGDRARLRLTHIGVSATSAPAYAAGWDVYLNRLVDLLAGREVGDSRFEEWPKARDAYAAVLT